MKLFSQIVVSDDRIKNLQLYDIVNATDFLRMSEIISISEIDRTEQYVDTVRKEFSKSFDFTRRDIEVHNLVESLNGQSAEKGQEMRHITQQTVFMRTDAPWNLNYRIIFILKLFGLQTLHVSSREVIQEATKLGLEV